MPPVVTALRTQFPPSLLGVPLEEVELTWSSDRRADGHQIRVREADGVWHVAEAVDGSSSIGVPAPGGPLEAREAREYSVRSKDSDGWGPWSGPVTVEAGVPGEGLTARMIGIPSDTAGPVPHLRTEFHSPAAVRRALLRLSGHGVVDCRINGVRTDDEHLTPGWTAHQTRTVISTHDVTHLLTPGRNAIGVRVGDGWFRGRIGWTGRTDLYGSEIGALVQLELGLEDGSTEIVASDASWRGGFGEVLSAGIYDGTDTDSRQAADGFAEVGFDDSSWVACTEWSFDPTTFEPWRAEPIRTIAELPMTVEERPDRLFLDSGQNVSGWVRLEVEGRSGDVVTVRHAEVLDPSGELHTAALRTARATDTYVLSGGRQVLEPAFTFHGFRYADVVTDATVVSATAVAVSSDLPVRSTFECSHEALNQFHSNVLWSLRDNFLSVPTDCPQRDERLGWTGDAQAFAPTANTLVDARAFWLSWLRDLELDQTDEGGVASVVPNIIGPDDLVFGSGPVEHMGRAGWADAACIVPWSLYESYGDLLGLRRQLSSMRRWVAHLRRRAGDGVLLPEDPFQYGDWLDPDAPGDRPWEGKTSQHFVANAYYVRSARLLARAEELVGDPNRGAELDALADRVAAETWRVYGADAAATQTGAALALEFGLCPDDQRAAIAAGLAADVDRTEGRIQTGFIGTPLVLFALSNNGYLDQAYRMLLRRDAPSWLYQVDRGATTVWERWDAIRPDGSIHGGEMDIADGGGSMLSFNHYAYGAMIDWVYRTVAGLAPDPDAPGYRRVVVGPRPSERLTWARASIDTSFGPLAIDWRMDGDRMDIELTVPPGSTAVLDLPVGEDSVVEDADGDILGAGTHRIAVIRPRVAH